jgi:hypothetical protein
MALFSLRPLVATAAEVPTGMDPAIMSLAGQVVAEAVWIAQALQILPVAEAADSPEDRPTLVATGK